MKQPVLVFGAGGLGKLALEIFHSNGVVVYGFLDDNKSLHGELIDEVSILGPTGDQGFLKLIGKKCQAFVAENDKDLKKDLVEMFKEKRKVIPMNAVHTSAYLSPSSSIGHGNLISAGVVVNAHANLGNHVILHAQCTIDYEVSIKDYVEIGAGSIVGSEVSIGSGVFIGAGVTLVSGVTIGDHARIGAGSVVISDVAKNVTVFGNPAQKVTSK